ncbi:hypothetical protein [Actinoplanes sp. G11-F43]|uniref:hypothetical protein n=1 Tax=Actinoplanes sp. G11-F43 TaxID=3424130 RepID=UPI003D327E8C
MIEVVPRDELIRRESLAGRVRDALAAAGLPIVAPHMSPLLGTIGAEVKVDVLVNCHAPVLIAWHTDRALTDAFRRSIPSGDDEVPGYEKAPPHHYTVVVEIMSRTMTEILTAEGFTVRDSTNDFGPSTLEVLSFANQDSWHD